MSLDLPRRVQPDPEYIRLWHANLQAKRLRDRNVSYSDIAVVMDEYHGIQRNADHWRLICRRQGADAVPKGRMAA